MTRKEIKAYDPVRENIIRLFEFSRKNRTKISAAVAVVIALIVGGWITLRLLDSRALNAQEQFSKGMEFFAAEVSPNAPEDSDKASVPVFKSDTEKYEAAAREFSAVADGFGNGAVAKAARYYLGLSQLKLGKKQEAIKNLESVSFGFGSSTTGFMARKVLAATYADEKDFQKARDLLQGMIKDPRCDLIKEELSLQLSGILVAQGNQEEAIKVLREASEQSLALGGFRSQLLTEMEKLQKASPATSEPQP